MGEWTELHPDKTIGSMTVCWFDAAEEVIGLIRYTENMVGLFQYEVGIGESLRPYDKLYAGSSEKDAEERFWQAVTLHARNM